jgi:hypothetical protein
MSLEYWPIVGYGVRVTEDMLDPERVKDLLGVDISDGLWVVLEQICTLSVADRILSWSITNEMYDEDYGYLYCPFLPPWEANTVPWCNVTPEQVEKAIRAALGPVLRSGVQLEFKEINKVGCG